MPVDLRVKAIFLSAVEKATPAEREAYLKAACAGDPALRQRIDALLKAHAESGAFAEFAPPAAGAPATPTQGVETHPPEGSGASPELDFLAPPRVPEHLGRLGHYEVQALIGQGGMGLV